MPPTQSERDKKSSAVNPAAESNVSTKCRHVEQTETSAGEEDISHLEVKLFQDPFDETKIGSV